MSPSRYSLAILFAMLLGLVQCNPIPKAEPDTDDVNTLLEELKEEEAEAEPDIDLSKLPDNYNNSTSQVKDINGKHIVSNTTVNKQDEPGQHMAAVDNMQTINGPHEYMQSHSQHQESYSENIPGENDVDNEFYQRMLEQIAGKWEELEEEYMEDYNDRLLTDAIGERLRRNDLTRDELQFLDRNQYL